MVGGLSRSHRLEAFITVMSELQRTDLATDVLLAHDRLQEDPNWRRQP